MTASFLIDLIINLKFPFQFATDDEDDDLAEDDD